MSSVILKKNRSNYLKKLKIGYLVFLMYKKWCKCFNKKIKQNNK